jgi:hypothetical protein
MMSITTILALIGAIETIIQDSPQAITLFDTVKAMLTSGTAPTDAEWSTLDVLLTGDHEALQSA